MYLQIYLICRYVIRYTTSKVIRGKMLHYRYVYYGKNTSIRLIKIDWKSCKVTKYTINTYTVFDLIRGLFAYVILGKKTPYLANPPALFFFVVSTVSVHYAICFIFDVLCLRLSWVQLNYGLGPFRKMMWCALYGGFAVN